MGSKCCLGIVRLVLPRVTPANPGRSSYGLRVGEVGPFRVPLGTERAGSLGGPGRVLALLCSAIRRGRCPSPLFTCNRTLPCQTVDLGLSGKLVSASFRGQNPGGPQGAPTGGSALIGRYRSIQGHSYGDRSQSAPARVELGQQRVHRDPALAVALVVLGTRGCRAPKERDGDLQGLGRNRL